MKTLGHAAFYGIALLVVVVDQAVKAWTRAALAEHETLPLWPGVFHLTHTQNTGMAFSLLEGAIPLLAGAALLVIGIIVAAQAKYGTKLPRLLGVALALPLGGAVGNLIDRLWRQSVTDLFDFCLVKFPVFNVADAAITVGVALLAWRTLTMKDPEPVLTPAPAEPHKTAAEPPAA
jgi:signal peptidase II